MDDILSALNKILSDVDLAQPSLREAVLAKKRVEDAMKFVEKSMADANSKESEAAFIAAKNIALESAPSIYAKQVRDAVSRSPEYSFDSFFQPLVRLGEDMDLYQIRSTGIGWARFLAVDLAMNEVAGTIEDYANAVESVRDQLKVKDGRDPERASTVWRTKIYGKGPYAKTIRMRLSSTGESAPFWSLLNDGSKNVSMSSDIGGSPYPSRGGHHFVQHTEDEIRKLFTSTFRRLKEQFDVSMSLLREALLEAKDMLIRLQARIDELSNNSDLLSRVAREIGVSADQLDASKIIIAAQRIRSGDIFTTQVVVGRGVRIRTKKFTQLVTGLDE